MRRSYVASASPNAGIGGPTTKELGQRMAAAHHRLRRLAPAALTALALVLAACSSSSGHKVHLSASKAYPNATAIATVLHSDKVACGTPTTVTKMPNGVRSEVSCEKTHYGVLDVLVFAGTTIPSAWTASHHRLCGSSAATDYVHGKNWAIVAANTATGNGGMERLAHRLKIAATSFCS